VGGSRIKRLYDKPKSPYRRLLENEEVPDAVKIKLSHCKHALDPFELKANITRIQEQLTELQKAKAGAILFPGPSYPQARERITGRLFG
jgi:hypothetical protein